MQKPAIWNSVIAFHGHTCPGIAYGVRVCMSPQNMPVDREAKIDYLLNAPQQEVAKVEAVDPSSRTLQRRTRRLARNRPDTRLVRQIADDFFQTSVCLEEVKAGVSTFVYRIRLGEQVYYLRILPEQDSTFTGEVRAHDLLANRGVKVPKVIHYEPCNSLLGLSLMIAEEIPGKEVSRHWPEYGFDQIVREAGKQLALVHQVPVTGFGWVKREEAGCLLGERHSFRDLYYEHLEHDLNLLPSYSLSNGEVRAMEQLAEAAFPLLDRTSAQLVHGDFDLTHIFHKNETYTGIIDFGEIMGHSPLYDLGHFKLQDGADGCPQGFNALLEGYREVAQFTPDLLLEIELWVLLIGVRRLGMLYSRPRNKYHNHFVETVKQQLKSLERMI